MSAHWAASVPMPSARTALSEAGITDEQFAAHPRAGRPQHRRQVAGRDRRVDPGPDRRGAGAPAGGAVSAPKVAAA